MDLKSNIKTNKNYIIIGIVVLLLAVGVLILTGGNKTDNKSNDDKSDAKTNLPVVAEKQTSGLVTAVSDGNITIKTEDGVSAVVYFTGSTSITKAGAFSRISEVLVGSNVVVTGITNADGTISCSAIAIK